MATYNNRIIVPNGNNTDVYHPETNSSQVYDFTNDKWLSEIIGAMNTLSTTQKSSIVEAINEIASKPAGNVDLTQLRSIVSEEVVHIESKVLDKVSILEYEHLKVQTSEGYDWQPVFQHIVDTFNGNVRIEVPYREEDYLLARKILVPPNENFILNSDVFTTSLQATNSFTDDFLIELQGGYFELSYITLRGNSKDGISLFGGTKGNYTGYRIEKIRLYTAEYGIRFDGTSEFPVGGQMEDVWAYSLYTCPIKMATTSTPTSGQSCHEFKNIRLNNSNIYNRVNNLATGIAITEGATSDTITWNATGMKEYGWAIMKKPKGVTTPRGDNWVFVGYSTSTSVTSSKASGTQWDYTVLRRTVGMNIKHLKAVNFNVLQSEYFSTGLLVENGVAITINNFYNEWRGFTTTNNPVVCGDGIYVIDTYGFSLLSGWQEFGRNVVRIKYSTGTFVTGVRGNSLSGSIVFYEGHTHNAYHRIGVNIPTGSTPNVVDEDGSIYSKNYIAENPKHGSSKTGTTDGQEFVVSGGVSAKQIVQYRGGTQQGSLEANSDGSILKVNKILVSNNNKNLEPPFQATQHTQISSRNVATPILKIAFPENSTSMFTFNYAVEVQGSNYVVRHVEGGTLKIAIVKTTSETAKFKVSVDDRISIAEGFSTTVAGEIEASTGNLIVKMAVDNGWMDSGGFARVRLVPISVLKPTNTTIVTQL